MNAASTIYLDYNATTPVAPVVFEAMLPYLSNLFGNTSGKTHFAGRLATEAVEKSRRQIAQLAGAEPSEIIYLKKFKIKFSN